MASGIFPSRDHKGREFSAEHHQNRFAVAGTPLTPMGYRGIWSELRGDWKWQQEALQFSEYWSKLRCCHLCRANKQIVRLLYTQFKRDDHIRKTLVKHSQFRDRYAGRRPHLTNIVGFSVWRCWVDAMHCMDLGVYQSVAASCLSELVQENVWPSAC